MKKRQFLNFLTATMQILILWSFSLAYGESIDAALVEIDRPSADGPAWKEP